MPERYQHTYREMSYTSAWPSTYLKISLVLCIILGQATAGNITYVKPDSLKWDTVDNYAGYIDVDGGKNSLFYWIFESRNDPTTDPIILWLNGGPGCSSMKGLMWANGPGIIQENLTHVNNPYSWNTNATVIWIDQPAGTGLSTSKEMVDTTVLIGRQIYEFLDTFFKTFTHLDSLNFHLAGQSDAGHYLADIAAEILLNGNRTFDVQSLSIGNGLINSELQYQYIQPMLCGQGGTPAVLPAEVCNEMDIETPLCIESIAKCNDHEYQNCTEALNYCNNVTLFKYSGNYFNLNKPCVNKTGECYPQDTYYQQYVNLPYVKRTLRSRKPVFEACNKTIAANFATSGAQLGSGDRNLTTVLNTGLPVLIFAGEFDATYNWLGNLAVAESLSWTGHSEFLSAPMEPWIVDNKMIAEVKNYDILTFAKVKDAGHLVSWDQPAVALELINTWVSGHYALIDKSPSSSVSSSSS